MEGEVGKGESSAWGPPTVLLRVLGQPSEPQISHPSTL